MRTTDYIDKLRKLTTTGSDYAVAKLLGISENAVNAYRLGQRHMTPSIAILVAEHLDVPPFTVICDVETERTNDEAIKAKWQRLKKAWPQRAAIVVAGTLAAALMLDMEPARALVLASGTGLTAGINTNYATLRRALLRIARMHRRRATCYSTPA